MASAVHQNDTSKGSVSVALCTYQGSKYLREQLDSIAAQTLLPLEVVVCDDGSVDDTLSILRDFADRVPFATRIFSNERNLGSTRNFEKAIRLCSGDYIALSDQDDSWHPEKLARISSVLNRQPEIGGVFTNGLLMDGQSQLLGGSLWSENHFRNHESCFGEHATSAAGQACLLRNNVVTGATLVIRSSLRDVLLPFPVEWVHDGWLAWMLALHSRLYALGDALIHYRVHQSQQVGVQGRSIAERLRKSRKYGTSDYGSLERQFAVLLNYVSAHPEISSAPLLQRIKQKRDFMGFRSRLSANYPKRWTQIIGRSTEYAVYAQGFKSMIKDALL